MSRRASPRSVRAVLRRSLLLPWAAVAIVAVAGPVAAKAEPAPEYSARLLDSTEKRSVQALRGEVLLLNTWATWCEPCREEMPGFEAVHRSYRDKGLRVVGVNIDQGSADGRVTGYVKGAGYTFEMWRDPANRFADAFRVLGPPETFLVGRTGTILRHWRGQMEPEAPDNLAAIEQALGLEVSSPAAAPTAVNPVASIGLFVAFGAGLLSVLSPCVLPLVPSYASMIAGVSLQQGRRSSPERVAPDGARMAQPSAEAIPRGVAIRAGLCFIAGFSAVFMALGVLVNRAGVLLADQRIWLTRIGGVILVLLGLHLMRVLRLKGVDREARLSRLFSGRSGYAGAFVVGVAFAAGWSPCIGPVLAGILTLAASGGSMGEAAGLLAVYSAGLAVPFLLAAFGVERFLRWSSRLRRSWLPLAERVSGAFLVLLGILLVTGAFSRFAVWLS